jgi:hypothetical protein
MPGEWRGSLVSMQAIGHMEADERQPQVPADGHWPAVAGIHHAPCLCGTGAVAQDPHREGERSAASVSGRTSVRMR